MNRINYSKIIGKKFNKLTIEKYMFSKNSRRYYQCLCECGNRKNIRIYRVLSGCIKSCGCLHKMHGLSKTRIYKIWKDMKQRCYNKNNKNYKIYYGSRGIKICDEWRHDFKAFYDWAIQNGYKDDLTIDRIDNKGNYEPTNCRWADHEMQNSHFSIPKNNKSGYVGVSWYKAYKKWISSISVKSKLINIGYFADKKEAVVARNNYIDENNINRVKQEVN